MLLYCVGSAVNELEVVDCTHGLTCLSSCGLISLRKKTLSLSPVDYKATARYGVTNCSHGVACCFAGPGTTISQALTWRGLALCLYSGESNNNADMCIL